MELKESVAAFVLRLWLLLTLNWFLGVALDKKYSTKKTKKRRKKGRNFRGFPKFEFIFVPFMGHYLSYYTYLFHTEVNWYSKFYCSFSGRKGSRAIEEEPDLGISYEVLPTGAGELPEVRNMCPCGQVKRCKSWYLKRFSSECRICLDFALLRSCEEKWLSRGAGKLGGGGSYILQMTLSQIPPPFLPQTKSAFPYKVVVYGDQRVPPEQTPF